MNARISLGASAEQRDLIDRAAQYLGISRSGFVLEAACDKAEAVLLDRVFFNLDPEGYRQFTKRLDARPARNPALERLKAVKAPWKSRAGR